ncbi:MAG TPA: IS1595 family transposase [Puia sp.]|nr:IS1595 family transposase [Puia sp.]
MNKLTITEFRKAYPNDDACLDKIFQLRFNNLICPECESDNQFKRVEGRRAYFCPNCSYQLYPTKDTVFEKTTTPLIDWFLIIYMQCTTRNGVSAKEIERTLNVCYKTALRMAHQIKILMADKKLGKLMGKVQVDESYFGMKLANKHAKERREIYESGGNKHDNKTGVMGFITDDKKLKFEVMTDAQTFKQRVTANVDKKSIVVTDSHLGYKGLDIHYIKHEVLNHFENEFKRGEFTTNNIENAWSVLKRTIKGTHIHVSATHLQKYVDEVAFRMMNKDKQDTMFETILSHVV